MDTSSARDKILDFTVNHPYILLAIIAVLTIIVIVLLFRGTNFESLRSGGRRKKTDPMDDETEIDELIQKIHEKQKRQ